MKKTNRHGGARPGAGRPRKPGGRADRAEAAELRRQLRDENVGFKENV